MNIAGIQAEATIAGLREQIKDNAVLLFPDQVKKYQNGDRRVPATDVFTVVVKKVVKKAASGFMAGREAGLYTAYLAYHDVTDGANKRAAEGGETQLMVMALQSLLDVLALGLFESGEKFTAEENVKWVVYGEE
ncbi:hypothetical protein LTR15_003718 [Elasticomyces elasticus]|nr:hypothetical protein LTR15_003718 [Elasticomyces elasticus]